MFAPLVAFAAPSDLSGLIKTLISIMNAIIPLIFGIAIIVFLWGIAKMFFLKGDDSGSREEGRQFIIWGIVALFIMVAFWGFVNILSNTFFGGSVNNNNNYPSVGV